MLKGVFLFLAVVVSGCALTVSDVSDLSTVQGEERARKGTKRQSSAEHGSQAQEQEARNILWSFIATRRLTAQQKEFALKKITTPPSPNTIAEAVLVVALLDHVVAAEEDASLREVAFRYNLDVLQALATNPFLNVPHVFTMLAKAMAVQVGDDDFHRDLESLLTAKLNLYRADIDTIEMMLNVPTAQNARVAAQIEREINTDLFRTSDNIILEADALADRGEYRVALAKLTTLNKSSPLYRIAQEKHVEISNKAVHNLRKRAALAFQKAGTISDTRTREAYLIEAKGYLEQALTLYPQADNLDTVKKNLVTIAKDLEKLRRKE